MEVIQSEVNSATIYSDMHILSWRGRSHAPVSHENMLYEHISHLMSEKVRPFVVHVGNSRL